MSNWNVATVICFRKCKRDSPTIWSLSYNWHRSTRKHRDSPKNKWRRLECTGRKRQHREKGLVLQIFDIKKKIKIRRAGLNWLFFFSMTIIPIIDLITCSHFISLLKVLGSHESYAPTLISTIDFTYRK